MPINSSSIPALVTAGKVRRRRRRKRYASGGSPTNPALWGVDEEELPAGIGLSPMTSAAGHIAKGVLWDLPHRAIDAAKDTSYGLRREDFTDIPPDYSPDPNSPLGGVGINVPKGAWQPTDPLIGASLEGATNVMGGTALSAPAKAAGEMVVGAGPRDPALWHGISKVRLPKPISEMSAVHVPTQQAGERVINPASLQGGKILPLLGDRTGAGTDLMQVNGYRFADPVPMQGGHGFMAANQGTGAGWASKDWAASGIANRVAREGADAPVYGAYTAMGERSGDFSHHVSDALSEMLPHTKISKTARRAFDDDMREVVPDWPGLKNEALRPYLADSTGDVRKAFVELMDTAKYQKEGFPSVAEARFATTDPRLLNARTGDAGLSIAKMEGRTFAAPEGQHRTYNTNVGGQYVGGFPASVPKEVMYPDIIKPLEAYRDALPGYKPTTDYLMSRSPKGLPVTQEANQKWVDSVSQHLEGRGFRLGAGATDRRAAALAAADDVLSQEARLGRAAEQGFDTSTPLYHGTSKDADFKKFQDSRHGTWTTTDPAEASMYAKNNDSMDLRLAPGPGYKMEEVNSASRVMPLYAKPMENPYKGPMPDSLRAATNYKRSQSSWFDQLRAQGYDGWEPGNGVRVDFNNANLRGQFSPFDPKNQGKSVIFGSGATDKRAAGIAAADDILEAERRLAGATHEPATNLSSAERPAAATNPGQVGPGGGGPAGARGLDEAQAAAARWAGARPTLEGQQGPLKIGGDYFVPGPIGKIHDVAENYMRTVHPDRPYTPPVKYHPIDPEHSKAIAQAYEDMPHTPNDPATKASYDALIDETAKQYQAIKATGLKIEPIPAGMPDPYATNPRLAALDVAENNHLWFFPTEGGFGTLNKISDNPMLRKTGEKIGDHDLLANDMFRVVHDYFGHLKEGHGFRAAGEDNAWRTHAQMYSDLARPAMTTETRGQNSWVNYGPHGEKNRTASGADTTYADQKVGLMPEWTMRDRGSPEPIIAYHGSPHSFDKPDPRRLTRGEGNQHEGHGLYLSENEPISEWYRHQLAARRDPMLAKYGLDSQDGANIGTHLASHKGNVEAAKQDMISYREKLVAESDGSKASKNAIERADGKIAYLSDPNRSPGHLYQVAIDAPPASLLDRDVPLRDQAAVLAKMRATVPPEKLTEFDDRVARGATGKDFMPVNQQAMTSMAEAGIPGARYDYRSSNRGSATNNYVMFDSNMLRLLRKYGIVGIPAAGVLGADGEERRAAGGKVNAALGLARAIKRAKGGKVHMGPIVGATGGRADEVPMEVPDGSYVLTADHCSAMGEGNTLAGFDKLKKMFPKSVAAYKAAKAHPVKRASGGRVPILAADGEFVICPEDIVDRWGDLDQGHQILDHWQTSERQKLIETLQGLDPPAQD